MRCNAHCHCIQPGMTVAVPMIVVIVLTITAVAVTVAMAAAVAVTVHSRGRQVDVNDTRCAHADRACVRAAAVVQVPAAVAQRMAGAVALAREWRCLHVAQPQAVTGRREGH